MPVLNYFFEKLLYGIKFLDGAVVQLWYL